jgi:hypothetical protein
VAVRARADYRQHSKSTLARAAKILFEERDAVVAELRRRWLKRVVMAGIGGFLAGITISLLR